MLPVSNISGGGTVNEPDQCLNRWVNFANMTEATGFSPNIIVCAGNVVHQATTITVSHGDEPDTGAYIPTIGPAFFPMGIPKVLINGIPAIALLSPSISNAGNATQGCVAIPSPVNVFIMYADDAGSAPRPAAPPSPAPAAPAEADAALEELESLAEVLGGPPGPGRGVFLDEGIGYIAVDVFSSAVPSMVHGALADLQARGLETLIFDLRDSRGGDVTAALELAGDFLPAGALVATLRDADGDETHYHARPGTPCTVPLVVLVNRRTASAAELFAGSLQAHGRALVVGERTFGKGTVAVVTGRPGDGGAERLSVATCLLPGGAAIQGAGITPDAPWLTSAPG